MSDKRVGTGVDVDDEELDFSSLLAVPWRSRWLIGFGTAAVGVIAVVYSLMLPRVYLSEGFYQLGAPRPRDAYSVKATEDDPRPDAAKIADEDRLGIPIPLFKTSATQFSNPNRLQAFASQDAELARRNPDEIKRAFRSAADINRWIRPVYAYARDDARDFVSPTKEDNAALGLTLSFEAHSPEDAALYVGFLGRYVRDCLVYVTLFGYVMDEHSRATSLLSENEVEAVNTRFELEQNAHRVRDVQGILARYPEASRIESRQVVSVQDGGYHYLSPVAQLVGIESEMADHRRRLARLERVRKQLSLRRRYFALAASEAKRIGERGEELLKMLKATTAVVFTDKELADDATREALNDILVDMERFELAFHTNCRFISGPTVPVRHVRPSRAGIVIGALVAAFVFFVTLAFVLSWWANNRAKVLG